MNTALTFWQRFRGSRAQELPLYIPRCKAVHTFGIKKSIDLCWVDQNHEIIRKDAEVPPRRIRICLKAFGVIESKTKGQALVEASLILPWMMILLWSFFQIGILVFHQYQMVYATHLAAEILSQTNNEGLAEVGFYRAVPSNFEGGFTITSQNNSGTVLINSQRKYGDLARIRAEWKHPSPLKWLEDFWTLESESLAVVVCDNPLGSKTCR